MSDILEILKVFQQQLENTESELIRTKQKLEAYEKEKLELANQKTEENDKKIKPDPTLPEEVYNFCQSDINDTHKISAYIMKYGMRLGYEFIRKVWASSNAFNEIILEFSKLDIGLARHLVKGGIAIHLVCETGVLKPKEIVDLLIEHFMYCGRVSTKFCNFESPEILDYILTKPIDKIIPLIKCIIEKYKLPLEYYSKFFEITNTLCLSDKILKVIVETRPPYEVVEKFYTNGSYDSKISVATNLYYMLFHLYPDLAKFYEELPLQIAFNIATARNAMEFKEGKDKAFMESLSSKLSSYQQKINFCVIFGLPIDINNTEYYTNLVKSYAEILDNSKNSENIKAFIGK